MVFYLGLAAMVSALSVTVDNAAHHQALFDEWKVTHSKAYESVEAEANAFDAFVENDGIIAETNAKNLGYWLGHNEFSDMTWAQFSSVMLPPMPESWKQKGDAVHQTPKGFVAPDSVDWVAKGAVTPVKNQQQCGSCWAFSTTGSLEGAFQIANGTLVSLSEQDLVACDKVDSGCNGGLMDNAFGWIKTNGICAESAYPYTSGGGNRGTCEKTCTPEVGLTGHTDVTPKDEDDLLSAVTKGPVSVAIEADKSAFQLYKGGVFDNSGCGTQLDHGVLVVGFGSDSGKDYWKVKNSWGATWGEQGHIRMVRNKNMCGVAQQPSYPTGAKALAPGPGPSPTPPGPSPTPSGNSHYEDPKPNGCQSDEQSIQIQGVAGDFCSPACTGIFKMKCPTDVPTGVTAHPQCALKSSTGDKYCALICSPTEVIEDQQAADAQCGTNASCKSIQGVGICTYDD